jgi:predicted AlkP superfamily pyrophosphatase or phosphodiesterase
MDENIMKRRLISIILMPLWLFVIFFAGCGIQNEPYVLLISFDGFRWDYMNRGITPNLDRFIAAGVKAHSLKPSFPTKTFPNHYSIVTGLEPQNHGIILNRFQDPLTGDTYAMGDTASLRDPKWYLGEPVWTTLKKSGIKTASFFWPGSEVNDPRMRPDYFKYYDHYYPYEQRITGVLNWLKLPPDKRPHFITLYFHETDSQGHYQGPDSRAVNNAIAQLDSLFGVLYKGLKSLDLFQQMNIIIVSDHGMSATSSERVVNISEMIPAIAFESWGSGAFMMLRADDTRIYDKLKSNEHKFKIYKKDDIPKELNFSAHPAIWPYIVIADQGYSVGTTNDMPRLKRRASGGAHGYSNAYMDMHGIFLAAGPAFKNGFLAPTLQIVDIYPLICQIFNTPPAQPIDGNLDRIRFILHE